MAQPEEKDGSKNRSMILYGLVFLAWGAYLAMSLLAPRPATNPYNLASWEITLLGLSITIPYLFIWLMAARGTVRLGEYQISLGEGEHHKAFAQLKTGLAWLTAGLIVTTLAGSVRSYLGTNEDLRTAVSIMINALHMFFPLMGFMWLYFGAHRLVRDAGLSTPMGTIIATLASVSVVTAVQIMLLFTDPKRNESLHLGDPLLVVLLIFPSMISTVLGALAVFDLNDFVKRSVAVIYERSLKPLALGVLLIALSTVILQLLLSVGASRLAGFGLGGILLIVYVFIGVQCVGYLFVARGAGRLSKLRETLSRYSSKVAP